MNRALFLDRDGTIIQDKDYLRNPDQVVIIPGAAPALKRLQDAGFKLFIVSNQSGVGRGLFTMSDVQKVNSHIEKEFCYFGVCFQKIYVAPEAPHVPGRGRKPSPQFLFDARDEFGLALDQSYMIGDKMTDLECGWNAGLKKCILVRTGYGAELERNSPEKLKRAIIMATVKQASDWILTQDLH